MQTVSTQKGKTALQNYTLHELTNDIHVKLLIPDNKALLMMMSPYVVSSRQAAKLLTWRKALRGERKLQPYFEKKKKEKRDRERNEYFG